MASSNEFKQYKYTKIAEQDSTRLLELLPGTDNLLKCRLVAVKLSQNPNFEALSYTWGKNEFPNIIEEVSSQLLLYITDNLRDALRALRRKGTSRMLWVDAVCINQSDEMEKGAQVSMMKDIYQSADRVIVWLGKQADDPGVADIERKGFEELERIGRNCALYGFDKIFPPFPRVIADQSSLEQFKELARGCDGLSLLAVYHREWYERVWVVQEFILAKDLILQFGSNSVSYDLFSKATAVLQLMVRRPILAKDLSSNTRGLLLLFLDKHFTHSWQLIQQRERYWGIHATQFPSSTTDMQASAHKSVYAYEDPIIRPSSIIEYCAFAKDLKCTNDIDRIYGMLGFAHDSLSIQPDYGSAPEKVWETLAVKTLLLGDLTALHYAGLPATTGSRVRSFAAVFPRQTDNTVRFGGHGHPRFHAATQIPAKVELELDGCVRVHAIKVDVVNQVNFVYVQDNIEGDKDASSPVETAATWNIDLSNQSDTIRVTRGALQQLYGWWQYWLAAQGPRFYSDTTGKWAFPRTIIAENALPSTKEIFRQFSLEAMDLLFIILILAEESTGENGNTKRSIDTWKVYQWMGKPMKISLSTFADDENLTTYHFPSMGATQELDDRLHTILSIYESEEEAVKELELARLLGFDPSSQKQTIEITPPLNEQLELYINAVSTILSQRRIFFTNVRLLGIGPKGMRPGDVIMVPEGSQTPFIYRGVEGGEDTEEIDCVRRGKLIGECYIYGLMDGDPVQQLKADYAGSHIEVILI